MVDFCRRHPVLAYCLLAFTITWGSRSLYSLVTVDGSVPAFNFGLVGRFGPSIAGIVLIGLTAGSGGIRRTLDSLLDRRAGARWILFAALFEPALFLGITALYGALHGTFPLEHGFSPVSGITSYLGTFITGLFIWGLAEEIGWRGWLFPALWRRMSPLAASLIMGVIITLWHIHPSSLADIAVTREGSWLIGSYPEFVERLIISVPFILVKTYIFIRTRGSLLPMVVFHSASNTSYFWVDETFGVVATDFFRAALLSALVIITVIVTPLLLKHRRPLPAGGGM